MKFDPDSDLSENYDTKKPRKLGKNQHVEDETKKDIK